MARRRREDGEDHKRERWVVSYADFITLLFAFFVVMYAISSLNEGKYRVLSNALTTAFSGVPLVAPPVQVVAPPTPVAPLAAQKALRGAATARRDARRMREIADDVGRALAPLVQAGLVRVQQTAAGVAVDIAASALFSTGRAELDPSAAAQLAAIAAVLAQLDNSIRIEGHTDNAPIATREFPSNWELSASRAAAVARLFIANDVNASRIVVAGYADNRPIDSNASAEGRAHNRRVTVMILAPEREQASAEPAAASPGGAR